MFLMETRLPKDKGKQICDKCGFEVGWELPREGMSGGLLLAWMDRQKLHIVYESKHLWLTHPSCKEVVQRAWSSSTYGSRAYQLMHKVYSVRKEFVQWNRNILAE
nr:hypothetical protein CFP56_19762 [Quercus suber]